MPIYAYRCEGCGFQKDALQKMSDPPLVDCPQCGQPRLAKQVTAAGFALKGTGWYVTDFRDQGKTSTSKAAPAADAAAPAPAAQASPSPAAPSSATTAPAAVPATPTSSTGSSAT
jgi:putative FmdB family regulatory protein